VKNHLYLIGLALCFLAAALALFFYLGRQENVRQAFELRQAAQAQHAELSSQIAAAIDRHETLLMSELERVRQEPLLRPPALGERLLLDQQFRRIRPHDGEADDFLQRLAPVWRSGDNLQTTASPTAESSGDAAPAAQRGWRRWYWEEGANFFFWMKLNGPQHSLHGTEQSRAFMVDLLLETINVPGGEAARVQDSAGRALHIGSGFDDQQAAHYRAPLPAPLEIWSLGIQAPGAASGGWSIRHALPLLLLGLGLLVLYLVQQMQRSLRQAGQQVSFVNQVSHELKTPLTNIRLYAELLQNRVGDDPKAVEQLDVVVSESHRLTRLIHNVLSFAQTGHKELELHPASHVPDQVIDKVVEQFRPNLEPVGLRVTTELAATREVRLDADVLSQILGNLLTNAEKYAAAGGTLQLRSQQEDEKLSIHVIDAGPGIPTGMQKQIFKPFTRLSNRLSDATGTGIGLTISRHLARRHGGDVTLLPSASGCHFCIRITTEETPI